MSLSRVALLLFSLCTLILAPIYTQAETSADVRTKIESHKSSITKKNEALDTISNRLEAYQAKKNDATSQLVKAKADVLEAQRELDKAKQLTGDTAERKQDLAQRRYELAERGVQSREKRLERLMGKYNELSAEEDKVTAEIDWLSSQIDPLTKKASLLAEQEKAAAALAVAAKAAPKPTPKPTPIPTPKPTPSPEPVETVETPASDVAVETPAMAKAAPEPEASPEDLTPRQRYARKEMRKLNEMTKGADKTEQRHYTEVLMEIDRKDAVELEYLGNNQFYGEVDLSKGKHTLTVNLRKFIVKIPDSADGDTFVVIYDTSDQEKARIVFFNKNLLD